MPDELRLTTSEEGALISALTRSISVAKKARSSDHGLFFQMLPLRDSPEEALEEFRNLLDIIRTIPALNLFTRANQYSLGNRLEVTQTFLVEWMISRAQIVGVEQTVKDVAKYLESESIEITEILTIDGLLINQPIEVGDYTLVPWDQLPMTDSKWSIAVRLIYGGHHPYAAITRRLTVPRIHVPQWGPQPPWHPMSIDPMLDVLRCVTAVAGAGIRWLHHWSEPSEWAPWAVQRSTFGVDGTVISMPTELTIDSANEISTCVAKLLAMDESQRQRLRVPIDRLNRSHIVGFRSVDAAIELGIALESLFAPTKLSEGISYTVRSRAARFLGGSQSERHQISNTLKDAYDLRSRAVHSGRFDGDQAPKKWKDESVVREVLGNAQRIVGRSLVKAILEGEPNWEEFDLT